MESWYINRKLCANLAYGLPELNKLTYLNILPRH